MPLPASAYVCPLCKACYVKQDTAAACQVKCAAAQKPDKSKVFACEVCGKTYSTEFAAYFHELRHRKTKRGQVPAFG